MGGRGRAQFLSALMILFALSSQATPQPVELFILASIDISDYVTVSGLVLARPRSPVPEATVTVQAVDPFGSAIHISRTMTGEDGSFSIKFTLTPRILVGNYTVHITADKEGYREAYYTVSFRVTVGDFLVSISPSTVVVEQGNTATYTITISSRAGFNETVTFGAVGGLPSGASHEFSHQAVKANASLTLSIRTTADTKVGNYTFTVVGSSPFRSRLTDATLIVLAGRDQSFLRNLIVGLLAVGVISLVIIANRLRGSRLGKAPKVTREYLATTRALVRLEELRAAGKIDQETYLKMRREYEEKLRKEGK